MNKVIETTEDMERCENCEKELPYEEMKHDREGVGLCSECYELLGKETQKDFEAAARPLMRWLGENMHPHSMVIVMSSRAELVEGTMVFATDDYILD